MILSGGGGVKELEELALMKWQFYTLYCIAFSFIPKHRIY